MTRDKIITSISLPNPNAGENDFYTLTLIGPNGCSLEAVTAYLKVAGEPNTIAFFGIWNHNIGTNDSIGDWSYQLPINSPQFLNNYVGSYNGKYMYNVKIMKISEGWQVYLFNFTKGAYGEWDPVGEPEDNVKPCPPIYGYHFCWDMAEFHYNTNAPLPELPQIESAELYIYDK
jgi:hypothetical protein